MINSFKQYLVEEEKSVYFTFGRMNPPTIGHGKLIGKLASKAGRNPYRIYLSQSQDSKKNPLSYVDKVKFARKMFKRHSRFIIMDKKIKSVMDVGTKLYDEGFRSINMVVGDDRINEFKALLKTYNGKKSRHGFYNFKEINVISAGERDPDSEGAEGASATKQRTAAQNKDFVSFAQGLPKDMSNKDAKGLFNSVRLGMGLKEETEFKTKIKLDTVSEVRENFVAGDIFHIGDRVVIKETDEVAIISHRGSNYVILEKSDNTIVRKWIDTIEPLEEYYEAGTADMVMHYAKGTPGQYPPSFKVETTRSSGPQDPDIKDRPGSQPKGYHKGLSKSTKIARDRQFKKQTNMPSHMAKDAPGDKEARKKPMPKSKHTKEYERRFGKSNEDAVAKAKEVIAKKKERLDTQSDRLLARARIVRANRKMAKARMKNMQMKGN